jgi:outer membrane receptor protein involved in Fe transport
MTISGRPWGSRQRVDLAKTSSLKISSYALLDARLGLTSAKGWNLSVWGRNLTDKYYWTNVFETADVLDKVTGLPRTFGITVGYTF